MVKSDKNTKTKDSEFIDWLLQKDEVERLEILYDLKHEAEINEFLVKHSLPESISIPIGWVFFATYSRDYDTKEFVKYRDNSLVVEWIKREITLIRIKSDETLKKWLKIKDDKIDEFIEDCKSVSKLTHPYVHDKTYLLSKLDDLFYDMHKLGIGQTKQINIVYDLFRQQKFEGYHSDRNAVYNFTKLKKERIRKMQEKAIKRMKRIYGTKPT